MIFVIVKLNCIVVFLFFIDFDWVVNEVFGVVYWLVVIWVFKLVVNVFEWEDNFVFQVVVLGLQKFDFEIELDKGLFIIKVECNWNVGEGEIVKWQEFGNYCFQWFFWFGKLIDMENVEVIYEQGILEVNFFKKEEVKFKFVCKIEIV